MIFDASITIPDRCKPVLLSVERPVGLVVIRGPNGSGKTTSLKVLCGFEAPTSEVFCNEFKRPLFVPANLYDFLLPWYSVKGNMSVMLKTSVDHHVKKLHDLQILFEKVTPFHESHEVSKLSRGQQSILSMFLALESSADIVCFDETLSSLHESAVQTAWNYLVANAEQKCVVCVWHGAKPPVQHRLIEF